MVNEFGAEEGFGGELFDFLRVLGVIGQRDKNAEQAAIHETPQGDSVAGDYIEHFARRRNPNVLDVDGAGAFGL
jgi:hypothetical protein